MKVDSNYTLNKQICSLSLNIDCIVYVCQIVYDVQS